MLIMRLPPLSKWALAFVAGWSAVTCLLVGVGAQVFAEGFARISFVERELRPLDRKIWRASIGPIGYEDLSAGESTGLWLDYVAISSHGFDLRHRFVPVMPGKSAPVNPAISRSDEYEGRATVSGWPFRWLAVSEVWTYPANGQDTSADYLAIFWGRASISFSLIWVLGVVVVLVVRSLIGVYRVRSGRCRRCGYSVKGVGAACPECGMPRESLIAK